MYNNSSETIPLKTPVDLQVTLRPWFDNKCLQAGLNLIREGKIHHFFFYRHIAAGLLENAKPLSIVFAATQSIKQGYTLKEHSCSFCGRKAAKKRCSHLAALAILSITARENDERDLFPIPLYFDKTGWNKIGNFLYSWLSRQSGKTISNIRNDVFQLKKETEQGRITVRMPLNMVSQWQSFFVDDTLSPEAEALAHLRKDIKEQTLTATEAQLLSRNSESRGSKCDASIWIWICRYFALHKNGELPVLRYDNVRKTLALTKRLDDAEFTLILPKNRTWDLLSSLRDYGLNVHFLPPAQECFQVQFLPSGAIQVIPSLRFSDNSLIPRSTLEQQKIGSHYFLPDEGFLPVKKLDQKGVIKHPDNSGQLNLFDFARRSQEQTQTFVVEPDRIHEFLEQNKSALQHPANSVDQDILEITTTMLPQELVIDKFSEDNDWCYLSCHYGMGDATISLENLLEAATAKSDFIPGQQWLQLSDTPLSWLYDLLPERLIRGKNGAEHLLRLRHSEFMALTGLVPEVRNNVSKKDFRKQLSQLLDSDSWSDDSLLHDCPKHLRDYQRTGFAWLNSLYRFGFGGLLADDMGLGKTHQGLALLDSIQKQKQKKTEQSAQLIICPASVLFHWKNKIDEFYPQIKYTIHYGPDRIVDATVKPGLLITTYTIARIDQDMLAAIPFDIILLDEIQILKNHKTAVHKAVAMLDARVKIGLTGTPVENSLTDLHALFSLCLPGFFGSTKTFTTNFLIPIKEYQNKEVEERLRRLIHPFILRRDRKQVLTELPDLAIDNRTCELSNIQVKLYREAVDESQELLDDMENEEVSIKYINILAMLTRLKQICNHPSLLEKSTDAEQYESGKWNLFIELLSECLAANLKIVVFSQYTGMLDIIEHYLKQTGIDYASLRGNMAVTRREKMIKKFSDDKECKVFCASLLAGGTGIDLVAAQVVIHYDRWWNPAKEAQATARVHRMGQKQKVQVFRLITIGTLEEKIHLLLKRKQEMSNSLISTDESGVIKKLDHSQLKELFRLD